MTTPVDPSVSLAIAVSRYETMRDRMQAESRKLAEEERARQEQDAARNGGTIDGIPSQ